MQKQHQLQQESSPRAVSKSDISLWVVPDKIKQKQQPTATKTQTQINKFSPVSYTQYGGSSSSTSTPNSWTSNYTNANGNIKQQQPNQNHLWYQSQKSQSWIQKALNMKLSVQPPWPPPPPTDLELVQQMQWWTVQQPQEFYIGGEDSPLKQQQLGQWQWWTWNSQRQYNQQLQNGHQSWWNWNQQISWWNQNINQNSQTQNLQQLSWPQSSYTLVNGPFGTARSDSNFSGGIPSSARSGQSSLSIDSNGYPLNYPPSNSISKRRAQQSGKITPGSHSGTTGKITPGGNRSLSDFITPPESSRSSLSNLSGSPKSSVVSGYSGSIGSGSGMGGFRNRIGGGRNSNASNSSWNRLATIPDPDSEQIYLDVKNVFSYARHGYSKIVERCIKGGYNPHSKDEFGNTLFHIACQNGNKKIAKMAVKYGGLELMNSQNKKGNTALHFLYAYGYEDICAYFIEKGADGEVRNMYGLTYKEGLK